jgi:hypothetical protein
MSLTPRQDRSFRYAAYLVRLWQDGQAGQWRASAQSALTGEMMLFASLAELFLYLEAQTAAHQTNDVEM